MVEVDSDKLTDPSLRLDGGSTFSQSRQRKNCMSLREMFLNEVTAS